MTPKRVLIITPDRVGPQRAGIAFRHVGLARALSRRGFEVTLASTDLRSTGLDDAFHFSTVHAASVRGLAERCDACLVQGDVLHSLPVLTRLDKPLIVDLICPVFLENLERYRGRSDIQVRIESDLSTYLDALAVGDSFICGSHRQRHFWLGMLAALGRIDAAASRDDPSLGRLISVVPFGVPEEPPVKGKPVLKGVVPGIEPNDLVLLWSGGLWSWLDPLTPIRAVAAVADELPQVKLVFTGLKHPRDEKPLTEMGERAVALARELGLEGRKVFFVQGWVPADRIGDYLLESDVGVIAHLSTVETTFAVRTRFWTYLWGGLPVIATDGDWVADTIRAEGLGIPIAVGNARDFAQAIRRLADPRRRAECAAAIQRVSAAATWDRAVAPLAERLSSDFPVRAKRVRLGGVVRRRRSALGSLNGNLKKFQAALAEEGLPGALRRSWRKIGGALAEGQLPIVRGR